MKTGQVKRVDIRKTVIFSELKNLLIAAHYLGQEKGIKGYKYTHPIARKERENLIDILVKEL